MVPAAKTPREEDPCGLLLLDVKDPMGECLKLLKPMQDFRKQDERTHSLLCRVYLQ